MVTEAEIEVMQLHTKGHKGFLLSPEARIEARHRFFLRRNQLCQHLDVGHLICRTVRDQVSASSSHLVCNTFYSSPRKLIHNRSEGNLGARCLARFLVDT